MQTVKVEGKEVTYKEIRKHAGISISEVGKAVGMKRLPFGKELRENHAELLLELKRAARRVQAQKERDNGTSSVFGKGCSAHAP